MVDIRVLEGNYNGAPAEGDVFAYSASSGYFEQTNIYTSGSFLPIGAEIGWYSDTAPSRWILLDGKTIGSAASGATGSAGPSMLPLFRHLWNALTNAVLPIQDSSGVATTRGASAEADFAANKRLPVPDKRQRFGLGKAASGTGSTLGGTGGNIDHTHSVPAHHHTMGTGADLAISSSGSHTHNGLSMEMSESPTASGSSGNFIVSSNSGGTRVFTGALHIDASSHTHASGNFTGRIGLVTGGVDGNAAMTSGTANPPFISQNFIMYAGALITPTGSLSGRLMGMLGMTYP